MAELSLSFTWLGLVYTEVRLPCACGSCAQLKDLNKPADSKILLT